MQPQGDLLEVLPEAGRGKYFQLSLLQSTILFTKSKPESKSQLLFVSTEEMNSNSYNAIMQNNPFRSYVLKLLPRKIQYIFTQTRKWAASSRQKPPFTAPSAGKFTRPSIF